MKHKAETKNCQNCKKDFIVESEDFNFYEKIQVPPPTFCPECRLIRQLAYRDERALYKDECDKCGKKIISLYAAETPFVVYCNDCWWKDDWEGTDYGRDYDFSRSFFEQFHELQKVVPCQAIGIKNSTDCKYCNAVLRSKNCAYVFGSFQAINCYHCQGPFLSRDCFDSDIVSNADHTYETSYSNNVFNTKFMYFSDECLDSSFVFNCTGCSNCFGCVNLRNQSYCIFNKKYLKEEYKEEIKKWNLGSYKNIQNAKEKFLELYYKTPRRFALIVNSPNSTGDDVKNTKNCKTCFATRNGVENSKYIFTSAFLLKDSYDVMAGGDTSELLYEVNGSTRSQRIKFSRASHDAIDVEYSETIYVGSNLFGCVKLRNKKYCILNKQYSKEEYEEMILRIIKHMNDMPYIDGKGRVYKYGEFFPTDYSYWAYNETWAQQHFPLTKEKALEQGYFWRDDVKRDYKISIKSSDLPDDISEVTDSILNEIIECEHNNKGCNQQCTTAFQILPNEFQFYKQMNIALPRLCPNCRHYERFKMANPPKLWQRKCMCSGIESENGEYKNTIKHFHGDKPCENEFETAISEDRKEIVYCKECYQTEFI